MNIRTLLSVGSLAASLVIPSVANAWPHGGRQNAPQASCPQQPAYAPQQGYRPQPAPQAVYVPPRPAYVPAPQPAYVPVPQPGYAPQAGRFEGPRHGDGMRRAEEMRRMEEMRRAEAMRREAMMRQPNQGRHGGGWGGRFNGR